MIRRGEGGWDEWSGPLWSPAGGGVVVFPPRCEPKEEDAGDHKGPPSHSTPPSPLQSSDELCVRLMPIGPIYLCPIRINSG